MQTAESEPDRARVFAHLMQAYQDMVYSTAVRLLGDQAQAEDIAQEVFLKAYERLDQLRASPTQGGWLKTVATNLCLNHLTRRRRRWRLFSEMQGDSPTDLGDELASGAERAFEADAAFQVPDELMEGLDLQSRQRLVQEALTRLPPHQRIPLVLFHFEEMPYEQIAAKLDISLAKLKTDLLRGRIALAKLLAPTPTATLGNTTHERTDA